MKSPFRIGCYVAAGLALGGGAAAQRDTPDTIESIGRRRPPARRAPAAKPKPAPPKRAAPPRKEPAPARAATGIVVAARGGQCRTIGEAIRKARPGQRIVVRAGLYH